MCTLKVSGAAEFLTPIYYPITGANSAIKSVTELSFYDVFVAMRVAMSVWLNPHGTLMARKIARQAGIKDSVYISSELWDVAEG